MRISSSLAFGFACAIALVVATTPPAFAQSKKVSISESTSFYAITGRTASDLARSMGQKGPYSSKNQKRAWATATRSLSYQLLRRKTSKGCRVKGAKVRLKVSYQLPKPRNLSSVQRLHRVKWNKMFRLLNKHERVHGKFYKQFANKVYRGLVRLGSAKNCRSLDRKAKALVKKLSAADSIRNQRFDTRDVKNYRRMERIYKGS